MDYTDVKARFMRNIGAITEQEQERLWRSRIFIAGCGGIGGYVIEHLVRAGVGHIICADNGQFEQSNLNRQILADMHTLGHNKTDCAVKRAKCINPEADIRGITVHLDEINLPGLINGCDLAIDALDSVLTRRALSDTCKTKNIPVIHAAVRGWLVQSAFVPPESDLYDLLYPEHSNHSNHSETANQSSQSSQSGVMSFTPGMAASLQAALAIKYLCGQSCDTDLHIYDMQTMQYSRVQI